MKAVLISIQPKWVEKIASGKKTIEVRKSIPKLETPFKCYIYCTQGKCKDLFAYGDWIYQNRGKVIGEFVCDKIYEIKPYFDRQDLLTQYECGWKHGEDFDCLSFSELNSYLRENDGFGWHISDLKIYDKPKELSEFTPVCKYNGDYCLACVFYEEAFGGCCYTFSRPPQSWCYVEVKK